jgi:hypothetical protein
MHGGSGGRISLRFWIRCPKICARFPNRRIFTSLLKNTLKRSVSTRNRLIPFYKEMLEVPNPVYNLVSIFGTLPRQYIRCLTRIFDEKHTFYRI